MSAWYVLNGINLRICGFEKTCSSNNRRYNVREPSILQFDVSPLFTAVWSCIVHDMLSCEDY